MKKNILSKSSNEEQLHAAQNSRAVYNDKLEKTTGSRSKQNISHKGKKEAEAWHLCLGRAIYAKSVKRLVKNGQHLHLKCKSIDFESCSKGK